MSDDIARHYSTADGQALIDLISAGLAATGRPQCGLKTRDFAMRPRLWLSLMTENRATISIAPPFGYELCLQRLRQSGNAFTLLDFSRGHNGCLFS